MNVTGWKKGSGNSRVASRAADSGGALGARPLFQRRGLALVLVLFFFALVTGLGVVLTMHAGQQVRADRLRTFDVELRQMIDSGVAYARLHRSDWPEGGPAVTLDASTMTGGLRSARITLRPTLGPQLAVETIAVTARLDLPRNKTRSQTVNVSLPRG